MPDLHGLQTKEEVAMSSPVVLITGALTGIGRATALAFANEDLLLAYRTGESQLLPEPNSPLKISPLEVIVRPTLSRRH